MSLTRSQFESVLVKRAGALMSEAGMETNMDGTNADLSDPMGYAVRQLGYTLADITTPATGDLTQVLDSEVDQLFDVAELRLLESILQGYTLVDITMGPRKESLGQLRDSLEKTVTRKRALVSALYGTGGGTLSGGSLNLNFQQHSDAESERYPAA